MTKPLPTKPLKPEFNAAAAPPRAKGEHPADPKLEHKPKRAGPSAPGGPGAGPSRPLSRKEQRLDDLARTPPAPLPPKPAPTKDEIMKGKNTLTREFNEHAKRSK